MNWFKNFTKDFNNRSLFTLTLGSGILFSFFLEPSAVLAQMYDREYGREIEQEPPTRIFIPAPATPLPENQIEADAVVSPHNETVDIQLKNQTNALITYQVIGHTGEELISGRDNVMLQDIPLPATVTLVREDNGLLRVIPISSDTDMLEVMLEEEQSLDNEQGSVRIQRGGQVLVY
jgi:hypothetical protein